MCSPTLPLKDHLFCYDSMDTFIENEINPPTVNNSKSFRKASNRVKILYWLQVLITLLLIILIVLFFVYLSAIYQWMASYIQMVQAQGVLFAPLVYIITCYLCICLLIPQIIMAILGGFIFTKLLGMKGIITAIFVVWFGCSLGATQSFVNARYLYQKIKWIKKTLTDFNDYAQIYCALKTEEQCHNNGFKLVFYMRLIPWSPYNIYNLSIAMTKVKLIDFIFGHIGMIPDIIMYCFMGSFIDSISRVIAHDNSKDWASVILIFTLIGSGLSIFVMLYIGKIAHSKYKGILQKATSQKQRAFPSYQYQCSMSSSATIKDVSLDSNVSALL